MSTTSGRPLRIADRLAATQRMRFVGRKSELAILQQALHAGEPPFAVLHIHGPGGIGKTTLLREFARLAEEAGLTVARLDARTIDATPAGFLAAVCAAMQLSHTDSAAEALANVAERVANEAPDVLIVDTYEVLSPLDGWLRETFLPQLPARTIVVIAGRHSPGAGWRTDPNWRDLIRIVSLRNLSPDESRAYLALRDVPAAQHDNVVTLTHGHPLALSLVADLVAQDSDIPLTLDRTPDVVATLLAKFVEGLPSGQHRLALQACAHARMMTEPLLREALAQDDVHDIFNWLRSLSFIEYGPFGLFPHDLARDVLDSEARWRDPDSYVQLHRRIRAHYIRRMPETGGQEQQRHMLDLVFLHRNNPIIRPYFEWKQFGSVYVEQARHSDFESIADCVARFEGDASAKIAMHWAARQPEHWHVVRDTSGEVAGYVFNSTLREPAVEDAQVDPAMRAVWTYVDRHGPLRTGEAVMVARFGADARTYWATSPVLNAIQVFVSMRWIVVPGLAWSFAYFPNPDDWLPVMNYLTFHRAPEADFEVGGRRYGAFAHDWRAMPVDAWLDTMGGREITTDMTLEDVAIATPAPLIVLSQQEFETSVKQALKDFTRPNLLASNPLMQSRLMRDLPDKSPTGLQALLREACESLRGNPKDEKLYRVLHRTYLQPAPSQEAAAEALDLPFGTYRSQLANAIRRVSEWLWQRELRGDQ